MLDAFASVRIGTRSAVLLVAWLHGIVAAIVLLRRARRRRVAADAVLAGILLSCCGDLTSHLIGWAGAYDRWPDLSFFPFGSAFAVGPLVWFHVRSLTEGGFRWRLTDAWHAVPFVVEKLLYLWLWQHPLPWKNAFDLAWQVPLIGPIRAGLSAVVTGAYLWLALQRFSTYRRWVDESQSDAGLRLEWLQRLLYVSVAGFSLKLGFDLLATFRDLGFGGWFVYNVLLASLTYYLSVAGLVYTPTPAPADAPTTWHEGVDSAALRRQPPLTIAGEKLDAQSAATDLASRDVDRLAAPLARLDQMMASERPWLNPRLTLTDLARQLNSNASAVSSLINEGTGLNFNDYVNGFRVRAVQEAIARGEHTGESLLALALDCGFNAKTTFNRSFRKMTGMSPTQFAAQARAPSATFAARRTESSGLSDS